MRKRLGEWYDQYGIILWLLLGIGLCVCGFWVVFHVRGLWGVIGWAILCSSGFGVVYWHFPIEIG